MGENESEDELDIDEYLNGITDDQELEAQINSDTMDKNQIKDEIKKLKTKIMTQGTVSTIEDKSKMVNNDLLEEIRDILAEGADV